MPDVPSADAVIHADAPPRPIRAAAVTALSYPLRRRQELSGGFRKTTTTAWRFLGHHRPAQLTERSARHHLQRLALRCGYVQRRVCGAMAAKRLDSQRGRDHALNPDLWNELLNLAALHNVRFVGCEDMPTTRRMPVATSWRSRRGRGCPPPDEGYENAVLPDPPRQLTLF